MEYGVLSICRVNHGIERLCFVCPGYTSKPCPESTVRISVWEDEVGSDWAVTTAKR